MSTNISSSAVPNPAAEQALASAVTAATAKVSEGIDAAVSLGNAVRKETTITQRLIKWVFRLAVVVIALLIISLVQSAFIIHVTQDNAKINRSNAELLEGSKQARASLLDVTNKLAECTTPGTAPAPDTGHQCYDESMKRQGDAIAQIIEALGGAKPTTTTVPANNKL